MKVQEIKSLHTQMDNIVALTYFLQIGGTKSLQMVCLSEQIWKLLLKTKVTVTAEYPRNALNKHGDIESCCKTFSRMETSPLSAPKALHENGKAINRPLCFQDVSPASNICSLEDTSKYCSNKCILNNLEQRVLLCIPFFLPTNTGSEQDKEGQDKTINSNNTMLADTVVLPPNIEHNDK